MLDAQKNKIRAPLKPLNGPTLALSTFGLGFLRPAAGTWGSMPPPALAALFVLLGASPAWHYASMTAIFFLCSAACVIWGKYAETRFGRKDAAEVVADETAAVALALAAASPAILYADSLWPALVFITLVFFAFRFFDIIKLWPANKLEKLPYGWGVLMDDLAAAIYAGIAAQVITRVSFGL